MVLVAAGIGEPGDRLKARLLGHAIAGATVVADQNGAAAWWRTSGMKSFRRDPDREWFSVGKGKLVAYKEAVTDPGEFALDLIDIVGQQRRAARLWNCDAGVALATSAPKSGPISGEAALHIINYGQPADYPVLARIYGNFTRATVLRPEAEPLRISAARRGSGSEVAIPRLQRVASVVFS